MVLIILDSAVTDFHCHLIHDLLALIPICFSFRGEGDKKAWYTMSVHVAKFPENFP